MRRRDVPKALLASAAGSALVVTQQTQAQTCNPPCYPRTQAEILAEVVPTNLVYPECNVLRYGASTTATDNSQAFNALIKVLLAKAGGEGVIPSGTYRLTGSIAAELAPTPPDPPLPNPNTSVVHGLSLRAHGAVLEYSGSGYALDFDSLNTSPLHHQPRLFIAGLNIRCTGDAQGGIRLNDLSSARLTDVFVYGALNGSAFTLRNRRSFSENTRLVGCGAVNCLRGLTFERVDDGQDSFARTYVNHFFGAGITEFWFLINSGCSVYDSQFEHISGNFGSKAYFAVAGDMSSSIIYGIHAEVNAVQPGQGVIRLLNYPVPSNAVVRRPILVNLGVYATFTGSGYLPVWTDGNGAAVAGPEPLQRQFLDADLVTRRAAPQMDEVLQAVALGNQISATATAGSVTLPPNPAGFWIINVHGRTVKVPYYLP